MVAMLEAMQSSSVLEGYLTRAELAKELNKSERTLDRWHTLRIGPPRSKLGRTPIYRVEAVRRWLLGQEKQAV